MTSVALMIAVARDPTSRRSRSTESVVYYGSDAQLRRQFDDDLAHHVAARDLHDPAGESVVALRVPRSICGPP